MQEFSELYTFVKEFILFHFIFRGVVSVNNVVLTIEEAEVLLFRVVEKTSGNSKQ